MDNRPRITVMINSLTPYHKKETVETIQTAIGKTITGLKLDDVGGEDSLLFSLDDGTSFRIWDDGQLCCEARYMRTDDNLSDFVGACFTGAEDRDVPDQEDEYGNYHEVQFLLVHTDKGTFTIANHNEHNGYYGGFSLAAETM